jgi:hypothetical protein
MVMRRIYHRRAQQKDTIADNPGSVVARGD